MKKYLHIYIVLVMFAAGTLSAMAQSTVSVTSNELKRKGNTVSIDATIRIPGDIVKSKEFLTLSPVLEAESQKMGLPSILINGKNRDKVYHREIALNNLEDEPRFVVLVAPEKDEHVVEYKTTIPWEDWMRSARFVLDPNLCGCGNESKGNPILIANNILQRPDKRYEPQPTYAYVTPEVETRKERAEVGTAFLDFQVGRYQILPDFRNNAVELGKIRHTIETVINDSDITPVGIFLKGFASPEGSYKSNATLAKNRTEALRNYIMQQYRQFPLAFFTLDSQPEDWDGFKARVEADMNVPSRAGVLDIINSSDEFDVKERKLRALDGGAPYKYVLAEHFPPLRRTEYRIDYTVRGFSVEEGREVIKTRPQHLSLNEMFAVANTYEPGSADYNNVFEVAVRMFPEDEVANLNAANIAISKNDYAAARNYITKAGNSIQAVHTRGVLNLLEGNLDEAEKLLTQAQNGGVREAAANLEELRKKREDNALFAGFDL
ncbi:hypothetical protein M2480_003117 [Parabacteroides sp. PFB2-12]|uniref:DUF3868 domain-containing protein n=1 Tax=unclassified Parabacteroides TaxID=2649774 RepID=UPI002473AA5F|nr:MULTISPECIES: DUF3868 domain-containing protein [unclassified Parabacteroides]MDH6344202.1 hypothetical protein [Parabacteroides sp. PM6-13]MDH6392109.1 hypothetical protein [Parabacteroides sp. PFB2-12]